jgi:hypothetical protein
MYAPSFAAIIAPEPIAPTRTTRLARPRYSDQQIAAIHARFAELEHREHVAYIAKLLGVDPVAVLPFIPQHFGTISSAQAQAH